MNKRFVCVILCFILLLGISVPAYAEQEEQETPVIRELKISTAEEFLEFAENCRLDSFSQNLQVSLEADIDLTAVSFEGIPTFSGTLLGKGNTISGVSITQDGSQQGLIRYLTSEGSVKDLTVEGVIQPGGSHSEVGGIVGNNAGMIQNCTFSGTVSGGDYIGGIAGRNMVTGVLEWCTMEGTVHGDHFVGGIVGENLGVIRKSSNTAHVNTTQQQNAVSITDITLDSLVGSEAVNTVTDIGGIAGISSGVIRECKNRGDVGYQLMGYNIGGIAGTQSGYIVDCENFADIQGRKETGGIVGQMEPVAQIEFSADTLQILQEQLITMTEMVDQTAANAQTSGNYLSGQIGKLKGQAQTAKDAVETLIPSSGLPDLDTVLAAQNTLSSTMEALPQTLRGITSGAQSLISGLNKDLNAISNIIGAMGQTIEHGPENLGGSITDLSDMDTPELLTGKVENCRNQGSVLADLNVGGITGAIALENDLDVGEDWEQLGESSLNFQSDVRAVILDCVNTGAVTGKKQNVGGITGWQSLGLVKNSINSGKVDGVAADYVGGVSGRSNGYIRTSYAKCEILGNTYVGGIAGSASIVTDSLSHVMITGASEKMGGILGWQEACLTDEENPIFGNYYLCPEEDYGAIDGISYSGIAEPKQKGAFLVMKDLPSAFKRVTVRFCFADGSVSEVTVPVGGHLMQSKIPAIPEINGQIGYWNGLAQADLTNVLFDKAYEAVYKIHNAVIESEFCRENGRPILLLEGTFTNEAVATVEKSENVPIITDKETLLEAWQIQSNEAGYRARFLLPEGTDTEYLKLLVCTGGAWKETQYYLDGSYLIFDFEDTDGQIALVQETANSMVWVITAACLLTIVAASVIIICKKRVKKEAEVVEEQV